MIPEVIGRNLDRDHVGFLGNAIKKQLGEVS